MTIDRKIVKDCAAGKRRAQSKLYQLLAPVMMGVSMRYCRNVEEAEDVLQEAFIKVFKNIGDLRNPEAVYSWTRSILVNTAITHIKKNKYSFEEIDDDKINHEEEQDNYSYSGIEPETLLKIIHEMPDGYRMVLNLYVFEGLKHREIADKLEISENTSKSQLSKARNFLRKELERKNLVTKKTVTHAK